MDSPYRCILLLPLPDNPYIQCKNCVPPIFGSYCDYRTFDGTFRVLPCLSLGLSPFVDSASSFAALEGGILFIFLTSVNISILLSAYLICQRLILSSLPMASSNICSCSIRGVTYPLPFTILIFYCRFWWSSVFSYVEENLKVSLRQFR